MAVVGVFVTPILYNRVAVMDCGPQLMSENINHLSLSVQADLPTEKS